MVAGAGVHRRSEEERAIRLRSTGLGKTELVARVDGLKRQGNHLVLSVKTTEPVSWHVRAAISYSDLMTLVRLLLRPKVVWYVITGFFSRKDQGLIDDF